MFTVNIKGRRDPRNIEMAKIDIIFYKWGYPRVTKVLKISGIYREWDPKTQSFAGKETTETNKFLQQEKAQIPKNRRTMGVSRKGLDTHGTVPLFR